MTGRAMGINQSRLVVGTGVGLGSGGRGEGAVGVLSWITAQTAVWPPPLFLHSGQNWQLLVIPNGLIYCFFFRHF